LRYDLNVCETENYNETLHRLIRAKQAESIDDIRDIPDITIRAIAALLYGHISVIQIAGIMQRTPKTIYNRIEMYLQDKQ
jgi:hypothetical protein